MKTTYEKENHSASVTSQSIYDQFSVLKKQVEQLCQEQQFDRAVNVVTEQLNTFYSVAYILLGNVYLQKIAHGNFNDNDLAQCFLNFKLGQKYSADTMGLVTTFYWTHSYDKAKAEIKKVAKVELSDQSELGLNKRVAELVKQNPVPENFSERHPMPDNWRQYDNADQITFSVLSK